MKIKKSTALLMGLLFALCLFAGCGIITPQPAETGVKESPTTSNSQAAASQKVVYMTKDISPEGLTAVYRALEWQPKGKVAVKLSTGEPPASNYLRPELIKDLVRRVSGAIVECNTAYGGSRAATAMHYQVAEDHGFTKIAKFQNPFSFQGARYGRLRRSDKKYIHRPRLKRGQKLGTQRR